MNDVISPGLIVPSGSIESQRSQIVVAPIVTGYSHDGFSVCVSRRRAVSRCPVRVSASWMIGVPTNPVPMRYPDWRVSSASRAPSACCWSAGAMSNTIAIAYAVCASDIMRPPGVTYSARNAVRTSSAIAAYRRASSSLPRSAAARATASAERKRYADATMSPSVLAFAGRSGGASGSSQSPNWNMPSHRRRGPASSMSASAQAFMLGYWRSTVATSA